MSENKHKKKKRRRKNKSPKQKKVKINIFYINAHFLLFVGRPLSVGGNQFSHNKTTKYISLLINLKLLTIANSLLNIADQENFLLLHFHIY